MNKIKKGEIRFKNLPTKTNFSVFDSSTGVKEYHITITPKRYDNFENQLRYLEISYEKTLKTLKIDIKTCVFRRFFCSDLYNQRNILMESKLLNTNGNPVCSSFISQIPEFPSKVCMWAYHINDNGKLLDKSLKDNSLFLKRKNLIHIWTANLINTGNPSVYFQTQNIIEEYINFLLRNKMKLSENVIRTWFFIQNIDTNYKEFAKARKEIYEKNGLTKDTHFIASTGVEGYFYDLNALVIMDAYAIKGIKKEQIKFLSAPEFLSPTYIYGVTFERGVSIAYSDRKHIFISGTASINKNGEIEHPYNIEKQTERTLKNIKALLKNADSDFNDVMIFIVYVRDMSDLFIVKKIINKKFRKIPVIFACSSICRPGWLVEIECIAIKETSNPHLPSF